MLIRNSAFDLVLRRRVGQQLHGLDGVHVSKDTAENADAFQLVGMEKQLFLACAGAVDVNGGPDSACRRAGGPGVAPCCRCP